MVSNFHGSSAAVERCRFGLQLQQVECCDLVFNFNKSIDVGPMVADLVRRAWVLLCLVMAIAGGVLFH
uniref:Uncharacterized protein n=1 Tax=Fagus sylvatica TaxID=28930 RepID=A0A2N9J5N7_FAGSY